MDGSRGMKRSQAVSLMDRETKEHLQRWWEALLSLIHRGNCNLPQTCWGDPHHCLFLHIIYPSVPFLFPFPTSLFPIFTFHHLLCSVQLLSLQHYFHSLFWPLHFLHLHLNSFFSSLLSPASPFMHKYGNMERKVLFYSSTLLKTAQCTRRSPYYQ